MLLFIVTVPIIGAFLIPAAAGRGERARDLTAVSVTAVTMLLSLLPLFAGASGGSWLGTASSGAAGFFSCSAEIPGLLGEGLSFTADGFRSVYAAVTAFMWLFTSLFSLEYFAHEREHLTRYWFFVLVTLGATEGVMLSGDLMTSFVFFEILSFTSFTWVIHEETEEAVRAGYTYLFIAVTGGLILFMGLLLLKNAAGTLSFRELAAMRDGAGAGRAFSERSDVLAASICILIGFGAKAGMYPVHIWLPKAHPVAPSPASALLSGILTKVGIYGILMTSLHVLPGGAVFGETVLFAGVITMALGAVLALFSVNLKRTLACSSMSQIGFILTGTGMYLLLQSAGIAEGAETALSGVMLHMLNHSLIKLTLFMAAGAVVMNAHTLDLSDLRGWGRNKPFLKAAFALGALGISGVPLFNGYISKTLLHEGIVEGALEASEIAGGLIPVTAGLLRSAEWIFLISGGLTFAYMLKLFICIFVERPAPDGRAAESASSPRCMNALSTAAVFGSSLLMAVLGQPALMTRIAAHMTADAEILGFRAFTWENLRGGLISLVIGAAVYLVIVRYLLRDRDTGRYLNLWPDRLDLEELVYRPLLTRVLPGFFGTVLSVFGENRILAPCAKCAVLAGSIIGRILSDSTDAAVVLLRHTFMRERPVRRVPEKESRMMVFLEASHEASPLLRNFSFALMMSCIGILVTLGFVLWFAV